MNKKARSIEHEVKFWEVSHRRLGFSDEELKVLFPQGTNRRFKLVIEGTKLLERRIDKQRRVWIGRSGSQHLHEGDILVCSLDSDGTIVITKKS